MAFYLIWVAFSLEIIILIGEHCYTDFKVKNKISNFGAKFKHCLWQKLFLFGHRSLIRNNTQTAVTNMTKNRMLENKII